MRSTLLVLLAISLPVLGDEISDARKRWETSPHGPMLERILPPTFEVQQMPDAQSPGAQLTLRYCVQCHNLPNPAMHDAVRWPGVVNRMVLRMEGRGNLGTLMSEMIMSTGRKAPTPTATFASVSESTYCMAKSSNGFCWMAK